MRLEVEAGFIRIDVSPGRPIPAQEKMVRAACRCSMATGAAIVCRTGEGVAAMELLRVVEGGLDPAKV